MSPSSLRIKEFHWVQFLLRWLQFLTLSSSLIRTHGLSLCWSSCWPHWPPTNYFKWAYSGLFFFTSSFFYYTIDRQCFAYVEIQTTDLCCRKQLLCQARHNHCQGPLVTYFRIISIKVVIDSELAAVPASPVQFKHYSYVFPPNWVQCVKARTRHNEMAVPCTSIIMK